jgi:hypothetical protein
VLIDVWQINGYGGLGLSRAELHRALCIILPRHITERIAKRHRVYRLHPMHSKCSARGLVHIKDVRTCITSASGRDSSGGCILWRDKIKNLTRVRVFFHNSFEASSMNMSVGSYPLIPDSRISTRSFSQFTRRLDKVPVTNASFESYNQLLKIR